MVLFILIFRAIEHFLYIIKNCSGNFCLQYCQICFKDLGVTIDLTLVSKLQFSLFVCICVIFFFRFIHVILHTVIQGITFYSANIETLL